MAPSVVVLLLCLLGPAGSLPPPRTSFLLNSADRPLVHFGPPDVHNTTTLLLSNDGSTLYVGARDAVLSLDVSQGDVISLKGKVEWRPSQAEVNSCQDKGKNPTVDCPNFIHVLQPINSTHLYACGSYAYSPHEAYIEAESFSMLQHDGAKGRCPFSPFQRNTAISVDGELFTASMTDFRGVKPQISRHFSKNNRPDVNLDLSVSLLEEPVFVSSTSDPAEKKLYFFFTEVGNEFSFVDDLKMARVAQVCKDDVGGQRTLQKKWTSFAKASLLCQSPKQLPFNVLQDVFTLQPPEGSSSLDTLFYGVFSSQWSLGPQSAVCVFRLQDIRTVFAGSYRTLDLETHQWKPLLEKHWYLGKCGLGNASDSDLAEVKRSFLTSSDVKPVTDGPVVVSSGQRYSRVAAVRTEAANGKEYTVLFLLTESGFLHKVVLFDQGASLIEEIQVFREPQLVKSIVLSSTKGVVYVGTSEGVTAVPVAKCSIYRSCSQCVLARDPFCGWSLSREVCSALDSSSDAMVQDLENGNVEEKCQRQARASQSAEVSVHLNEVVRLPCLKPSNLATLTWTSPQFENLTEKLFIQSADGSLSFLAAAATFGTYHCEAEEDGYKVVVASYTVGQMASPRFMNPSSHGDKHHMSNSEDGFYEDIITEEPLNPTKLPSGDAQDGGDEFTTNFNDKTAASKEGSGLKSSVDGLNLTATSRTDTWSGQQPVEKSYFSELVVVSLLLVICICVLVLAGVHTWRQRKTGLKMDPLVGRELSPELKVVE
ncbi:semaphorin-4A-like [Toxotes jaculatrix]|uniref:semaphorin-4A-like n=1 Tax=Toxotes jaculatrix TaxID=941984 RepID=UPI001B3A7FE2|nr:semaphorin-4A-like [Toxotes jaculatrix]